MVGRGEMGWFGCLRSGGRDGWVSACRGVRVAGEGCGGRGTWVITWGCMVCSLSYDSFREKRLTLAKRGRN